MFRPATPSSIIRGVVRDGGGTPESGVLVELLRPNHQVIAETATDSRGRYALDHIRPGKYDLRASSAMFLPTVREGLSVSATSRVVVDFTLNTLYEAFRWLPAEPRAANEPSDDWTWTLRLAANRPILRMFGNGPLVEVTDSNGTLTTKGRVELRGGGRSFGEGGLAQEVDLSRDLTGSQGLLLRAALTDPLAQASPAMQMVAGYEHRPSLGNSFRTVAILEDHPEIVDGAGQRGLSAFALRNAETIGIMPGIEAEVGDQLLGLRAMSTTIGNFPFARLTVQSGQTTFSYAVATSPDAQRSNLVDQQTHLSALASEVNGRLTIEHGLHQQFTVTRSDQDGRQQVSVSVYHDQVQNPVLRGEGMLANSDLNSGQVLFDPGTRILQAAARSFQSTGVVATVKSSTAGNLGLTLNVATGEALAAASQMANETAMSLAEQMQQISPQMAEMIAVAASGTIVPTGTAWRTSYRWQSGDTLTRVAPFAISLPDAYLSVFVRQPLHSRMLPNGFEVLAEVRNLLAQGYRPFLSSDGSHLYFAQVSRSIAGGISFSF